MTNRSRKCTCIAPSFDNGTDRRNARALPRLSRWQTFAPPLTIRTPLSAHTAWSCKISKINGGVGCLFIGKHTCHECMPKSVFILKYPLELRKRYSGPYFLQVWGLEKKCICLLYIHWCDRLWIVCGSKSLALRNVPRCMPSWG